MSIVINYVIPATRWKARDLSLRNTWNKYHAKPQEYKGMKFDSKVERDYFIQNIEGEHAYWTRQEKFEIIPSFKLGKHKKRHRVYTADFVLYDDDGNMVKVIDVKGRKITADASLRMNLFEYKYGIPITIAKYDYKTHKFEEKPF